LAIRLKSDESPRYCSSCCQYSRSLRKEHLSHTRSGRHRNFSKLSWSFCL